MKFADIVLEYYLVHRCSCSLAQLERFSGKSKTMVWRLKAASTFAEVEVRKTGNMDTFRPTLEYMASRLSETLSILKCA